MKVRMTAGRWFAVAMATLGIALVWGVATVRDVRDSNKVKKMTQKMMTVCVGRFLIDLPQGSKVLFTPAHIGGMNISTKTNESDQEFADRIAKKETEIAGAQNELGGRSLEEARTIARDGMSGKFFVFGRTSVYGFHGPEKITLESVAINGFVRGGGLSFNFLTKSIAPEYAQDVYSLIEKLKPLAADDIPSEPGFCINRGIILDPLDAEENEMITMFATPPGHPDIAIRLNTMMNLKRIEESLLARNAKNDIKLEYSSHFKTLREGKRVINGIEGEELLERVREFKGTSAHDFMWEASGKMKDVLAPTITMELDTGKGRSGNPLNASLSDQAVLELWERISSSLRVRPTSAPGKTSSAAPPLRPLGELVATGYACPQTGWWECDEEGEVYGERRRHFQAGERMPHATLWGEPNLWQKLRGERPVYRTGTVWRLVAYGDAPPAGTGDRGDTPSPGES